MAGRNARRKKDFEKNKDGTNGDSGIGDIEGGPRIENSKGQEAERDFQKISDRAVKNAVGEIAGSAAEEQGEASGGARAAGFACDKHPGKDSDHHERADDQKDARGGGGGVREETETDSWVSALHQINGIADHFPRPASGGVGFEPGFRGAVEKDDDEGEPEPAESGGEVHEVKEISEVNKVKEVKEVRDSE